DRTEPLLPGSGKRDESRTGADGNCCSSIQQSGEGQDRVCPKNLFREFLMLSKGFVAVLFFMASVCRAGMVYNVFIDTSSQSGNNGAIYFQFAGGLNPGPASISITMFSVGAPGFLSALPAPFSDGGATGSLDALPLTIDNSGGLNDYEHFLVYGSSL